jgi:translation initiation factor eIF-2B subunit gamma
VHTTAAPNKALSNPCLALPAGTSVKPKFQSILLADTTVGDKVTFKSCVVGKNCKLGAKCRLNNVVLQDNVTVGDNTILQNTVVGSNSVIAENCNLNDCQLCPGKSLLAGTKKKGEAFIDDI